MYRLRVIRMADHGVLVEQETDFLHVLDLLNLLTATYSDPATYEVRVICPAFAGGVR